MLIRTIFKRSLTNLISYSFELKKQPVEIYFSKNFKLARDQIQKISTQYKMTRNQSNRFFHYFPQVFKPQSKQFNHFKNRIDFITKLSQQEGKRGALGRVFLKILFQSKYLAFQFKEEQFQRIIETVQKYFANQQQMLKIFKGSPNLANPKFPQILLQKLIMFTDYLQISNQQAMKIFQESPFLLSGSTRKIRQSIGVMYRVFGFSKEEMIQQMKKIGEIYLLGGPTLKDIYRTPINWGLTKQQVKQAFLKHPLLFFNYPYTIMPFKRRILKYLTFTTEMAQIMMRDYPQIMIWSVRSLQQKALFINNRLQLKLTKQTLQLLTFNFNKTLRPRGEILIRSKTPYDNSNIVNFMKMSDEQFVVKTLITKQRLQEQVAKFPITNEMDFKKSKVLDMLGTRQKMLKMVEVYQH